MASRPRPQLQVETKLDPQPQRRGIRWVDNFADLYKLGGEVMPSVHRDMEVRRASPKTGPDREEVVIKVRWKKGSFHGRGEEKAWRANTEVLLNLPPCSSIARLHEVLEDNAAYYVVMEKVGGMDLFETLHLEGRLPLEEIREVLRQLIGAVGELHASGCIHKDLKLENVMLDKTPTPSTRPPSQSCSPVSGKGLDNNYSSPKSAVKLIDFDTVEEWTPKSPKASDVLGTDQYIAPEAYDGRYSPASDMFAVGVIAYKLLTGQFPFRGAIFDDKPGDNWVGSPKMKEIKDKLHDERLDWRHPVFGANPALQHLLARMLSVNEAQRPSAREVLSDPWFSQRPPPSRRHSMSGH